MRYILSAILAFLLQFSFAQISAPTPYQSGVKVSYVRAWEASVPEQNIDSLKAKPVSGVKQTTVYVDGLGRPIQTVQKQISPNLKDMVISNLYDEFGREAQKYLPYEATATAAGTDVTNDGNFKLNAFQQQAAFSQSQYPGQTYFYGQTYFEPSPLNRVTESFAPGNSWVGTVSDGNLANHHSIRTDYLTNSTSDSVRIWVVNTSSSSGAGNVNGQVFTYATSGIYSEGQLYKTVTYDEHAKQTIEFKDKEGKTVLKKLQLAGTVTDSHSGWLCTYYVYDEYNNLKLVIPPRAVELAYANSWSLTYNSSLINELCFIYYYDNRNRVIAKKVPGSGNVSMVYDMLVMQDSNMSVQNKWLVTEYDNLSRIVKTGLWTNTRSRFSHQGAAKSMAIYPVADSLLSNFELLTENFYDNYDWVAANGNIFSTTRDDEADIHFITASNSSAPYAQPMTQTSDTKGMLTGTYTKVLGTSSQYLWGIHF